MKNIKITLLLICLINATAFAQQNTVDSVKKAFGFETHRIIKQGDTIEFYIYNPKHVQKKNLVVFLSGSTPQPIFTYEVKDGKLLPYLWNKADWNLFPADYAYVLIAKRGVEGASNSGRSGIDFKKTPKIYLEKNSLDYRVWQADEVINYCLKNVVTDPEKIIAYGHSEGFNVVAKLLTVNKKLTHAGLFAGSAMPDYFDFLIFESKELLSGKITDAEYAAALENKFSDYKQIFADPKSTASESIYTNKRWVSYAEQPINYLTKATIPLYMLSSTRDENAPIESTYIVPLEFIRLGKKNLTYKICEGCDHNFSFTAANGTKTRTWDDQIRAFISWIDKN